MAKSTTSDTEIIARVFTQIPPNTRTLLEKHLRILFRPLLQNVIATTLLVSAQDELDVIRKGG